jgi:hypothetical protein
MRLFITLLLFGSVSAIGQEKKCDCRKYQTGDFYIPVDPESELKDTVFISRDETLQTETVGTTYERTHQVIWVTPCRYVLRDRYLFTTKKYHPNDVVVEIIETTDDYYIAKAWAPKKKKMTIVVYVVK